MAKINLQPLGSHLIVLVEKEEQTTASGIVIAPTAKDDSPLKGKVIALGTGGLDRNGNEIKFHVKEGDTVMFEKGYASKEVKIEGVEYLVIDQSDLIAIVK